MRKQNPMDARAGQTLRFIYEEQDITAFITKRCSRTLEGTLVCGTKRGRIRVFDQIEMLDCFELFGSPILQNLLTQVKDANWTEANKDSTLGKPEHRPELNPDFMVPEPVKHKRLWHVMKVLGEGAELLCQCTTKRSNRILSRSKSRAYKKRWMDLTNGPRLYTFLGA